MATTELNLNVEYVLVTKDELRALIQEEVRKACHCAPPLPYIQPSFPGLPNVPGMGPAIWCGAQTSDSTGVSYNSDTPRWADDIIDGPGSSTR